MTRSLTELRVALRDLADRAPTVDALDNRAWSGAAPVATSRRPPRRRTVLTALASAAVVVALIVVGAQILRGGDNSVPTAGGTAALEVRPVVAPAVSVGPSGTRSADPLQGLTFPIPTSGAEYDRLTSGQQDQLLAALATTDCSAQTASNAPTRVACQDEADTPLVYLLGPSIFDQADLADAQPVAPSMPDGSTQWTVMLRLRSDAAVALQRYTTAHHTSDQNNSPTECGDNTTPCADYLAFVVNGSALSVPVTLAPLGDVVQISSNFTKDTATDLARELRPGG